MQLHTADVVKSIILQGQKKYPWSGSYTFWKKKDKVREIN
jgi:hypothetical protein